MKRQRRHQPTSREITRHIIYEVISEHPADPLPHLMQRTGATEAQCIIALRRDTRRNFIAFDAKTNLWRAGGRA